MDMYTHTCAQQCVTNALFASMCSRAFGRHKITYAMLLRCFGVLVQAVTCTKVIPPMVLVCPMCDDEKFSLQELLQSIAQHFPQVPRS